MNPRDEKHYRPNDERFTTDPKTIQTKRPETKRAVMKRKAELDAWAHKKGINPEQEIIEEDPSNARLKKSRRRCKESLCTQRW